MKTYLIITPNLDNIGGAQLYALRRAKYLKKRGYKVIFIVNSCEKIFLKDFYKFQILQQSFIQLQFLSENSKEIKEIINKLNIKGKVLIESNSIYNFSEIFAKKLNTVNYIYLLAENDICNMPLYKEYLLEKLKNKEIIGVSKESLRISYGNLWNNFFENRYVNIGFDLNEIKNNKILAKKYNFNKNKNIFRILTITRLDKTYVNQLIEDSLKLAMKYRNRNIELIIVGDSNDENIKKDLEKKYKDKNNFKIRFLGYINPLFSEIYKTSDIFIGMGTALINAASFKLPSIGIDPRNNKSSGYFGYDLMSFGYRADDKTFEIFDKLNEALSNEKAINFYGEKAYELFEKEFLFLNVMKKLDSYILEEKKVINYYKIENTNRMKLKKILYKLGLYSLFVKIYVKIFSRKKFINI